MFAHTLLHKLISLIVALGMVLTPISPSKAVQPVQSVSTVDQTAGTPTPDVLFRTRITVNTTVAWRDLERLDPLFLERGDDWALLLVDDAQSMK